MITPALLSACSTPLSILDPASTAASDAAFLWWGMFGFFTLVLCAVIAVWVYAIRRAPGGRDPRSALDRIEPALAQKQHQRWIIGGGIVLPVLSIVTLLALGIPAGNRMAGVGVDTSQILQIEVTAHQWWWEVNYTHSPVSLRDEIHIPAGTPVQLILTTADVIHAFWVPRIGRKLDMIPGRANELLIQADEPGVYPGVCAEFCGLAHAHMQFNLHVHSPEDFAVWQAEQQRQEPIND